MGLQYTLRIHAEIKNTFFFSMKNLVYILQICDEKIKLGSEEEVDDVNCKFSFHSHPSVLYDVYNFKLAWPSNSDYISFLNSVRYGTIFHIVIGNEGIYILSLSKQWSKKINFTISKDLEKFVINNYAFHKTNSDLTLKKYIKKVNCIKYKNIKIFDVEFRGWAELLKPFSIFEPNIKK